MFAYLKKKRIKREYRIAIKALQLSLYEVIVSILKDELGREYPVKQLKEAAAITVNKLGLRPDSRTDPLRAAGGLAKSLSEIINLTLIKEAVALILLFSYFGTEKKIEKYFARAKELKCDDFDTICQMTDINRTTPGKIRKLATDFSKRLHETALIDIYNEKTNSRRFRPY